MAKGINLEYCKREISSKGNLNNLRKQGMVPGVIYGRGISSLPVAFKQTDLSRIFRARGTGGLYKLSLEGEEPVMALLREVQKKSLTGELLHVDFMMVKMTEHITAMVPVVIVGEEELIKERAILQIGIDTVEIECFPGDLPDNLVVDISGKSMGDVVLAQEVEAPEGVRILTDPDAVVLVISHPPQEEEEEVELDEFGEPISVGGAPEGEEAGDETPEE